MTTTQAHALAVLVEEEIASLIRFQRWHRTRSATLRPYFADMEVRDRIALRTLLRLRRVAKRAAYRAQVEQDRTLDRFVDERRVRSIVEAYR